MKASSIRGMTPSQIQQNLALPETPDQIVDVDVPEGTLIRAGPVGANAFGPGNSNITQYQVVGRFPGSAFSTPTPLQTPVPEAMTEIPVEEPFMPDPMIDPIIPIP